jgi:2-polyprenyl-3-methyl-5-hydroxy-6-metoxy-1,4-benzoquinol methylase
MIKRTLNKMARSFERLSFTEEGVFIRSYRLGQCMAGLPTKYPGLFLKEIELGKLLMGGEAGYSSASYARITGDLLRPSRPIAESPHVELLQGYRANGEDVFLPEWFEATSYFKNAAICIELYGHYFDVKDPKDIVKKARNFCAMLEEKESDNPAADVNGSSSPVIVRRIANSDCFEIVKGQHRMAIAAVKEAESHECLVQPCAPVFTPIQQMIIDSNWTEGRPHIYQPISSPELATWPVMRRCVDRLEMMETWLAKRGIRSGSYLDICCSYGWFLAQMKARGFRAFGIDRDVAAVTLGRLVYGLDSTANQLADVISYLDKKEKQYDIVTCFSVLHHAVRGAMRVSAEEFIRKVDAATARVLFFDTGQCHEEWFSKSLAGWDAEFITKWLRENTSFTRIEILGRDSDNVSPFEKNYRRHFFACSRED